ncbi:SIS domain-containing protein [Streptomyces sp. NPDC018693]|uniref:D-sedoheptulose-7-phosphate isomerase n=1 Tax=unclassified Streptomyces TaxID=2593676 RepID=UPI0037A02D5B
MSVQATAAVAHCDELTEALRHFRAAAYLTERWGERLAEVLGAGGRLLAAGNGGSAAQAQHLTAELVGRYRDDRPPFSAIALHADTSSTTAIANDYGVDEVFARQVRAHGRPGDVLVLLSTSGASANLLSAADAARTAGLRVWALTGPAPNPLMAGCDEALCVAGTSAATVQEIHLVAVHMMCAAFDAALERRR